MAAARFTVILGTVTLLVMAALPARGQFEVVPQEPLETTNFYIGPRPNYSGFYRIFDKSSGTLRGTGSVYAGRSSP